MKAVYYHADSRFAWGDIPPAGLYRGLAERFRTQCNANGMSVVHLTCEGFPGWGDENVFLPLDPKNVVANREEAFSAFLETAPDDFYWFAEPDMEILRMFPAPACDATFLYRPNDDVPVSPGWRIARPKALPIFHETRDSLRADGRKEWHGDSAAMTALWERMGRPTTGRLQYAGCSVELRNFSDYVKPGLYTKNLKGKSKLGVG